MTITARNAGADTETGLSRPPPVTMNVAGTRTWNDPDAGAVVVPAGEAPPLEAVVVPPEEAPPLSVLVLDAVAVVEDVGSVLDADVLADVLLGVDTVLGGAGAELEDFDPPQPASAAAATAAARKQVRLLTFSA